jgi:hypothetical protein
MTHFHDCPQDHSVDETCEPRLCEVCEDQITNEDSVPAKGMLGSDGYVCKRCDNYDGPSDDDLSEFYGGGGVRPMSEQYTEAAEQKRRLS